MANTVPRFDPYIYLFGKEKNNEEGKIDVISWRRNIYLLCANVEEKKRRTIMRRYLLEEMKKRRRKEG